MLTRILLLLLSAFFLSWAIADLDQCSKITDCFVRDSCIKGKNSLVLLNLLTSKTDLKKGDCDVIIQVRPYSVYKYQIVMQVNVSDSSQAISDSGASLSQGEVEIKCDKKGISGSDKANELFQIGLAQSIIYEDKFIFCSFIMETKDKTEELFQKFKSIDQQATFQFTHGSPVSIKYGLTKTSFWRIYIAGYCNPENIISSDSSGDGYLQSLINTYDFPPITCEQPKIMIITRANGEKKILKVGSSLICEFNKWNYVEDSALNEIPEVEKFTVSCGVKFCTLCPPLVFLTIPGSSPPTSKSEGDCNTAICPENQWMLEDGRILIGEMECKQEGNERSSAWYFNNGSVSEKVEKVACFDKSKACSDFITSSNKDIKFDDACPSKPDWECAKRIKSDDNTEITCPVKYSMRWGPRGQTTNKTTNKLTCHFPTSQFRDEKSHVVAGGSNVYCTRKRESSPSAAGYQLELVIAGGVGGILALSVLPIALFILHRRTNRQEVN